MHDHWLPEEEVLAFDDFEPYIPRTASQPGALTKWLPTSPHLKTLPLAPSEHEPGDMPLRSVSALYDLPRLQPQQGPSDEPAPAKPGVNEPVPCCAGATRTSLEHHGRRVLCLSCKTIYRFGRPAGRALRARLGQRGQR